VTEPVWQGPMYRDCGSCNFVHRTYGRAWCTWCVGDIRDACRTLAHNLAIAGALCRAFELGDAGKLCGYEVCDCWFPGCQRSAP
jgi:hypothetical protein